MAQHGKTLWSEKGASESRASHRDRLLNWDGRGGGVPSSPSPERGETSLFGEAAGRQMVGLRRWALGGCIISPTVLDADTHVGEEPLLSLAPAVFMP